MTRLVRFTHHTFRSLRIRNYRLFFFSQLVSVTGTWMQWVAQSWLVLRLGGSGVDLGIATGLQFAPSFFGGLWGGLVADRFDKRRILILTQSIEGVLAVALGVVTAAGVVELWMVYLLAFLFGCMIVLDMPARHAFVTEMVGPDEVPNAVGLNSAVFNAGRIIGPALAAALIASAGVAPAFFINGATYIVVVAGLMMMDPAALHTQELQPRTAGQLRQGLRYVWRTPDLRRTIALVGIVGTFGFNFTVVLPLLASRTFGGGAGTYGLLTSIMAAGALVGALAMAARGRPTRDLLIGLAAAFGFSTILASAAPVIALEAVALVLLGAAGIAMFATANSIFQTRTPGFMRGRVMALYSLVFLGGNAVGGPVAGWIAEAFGPRAGLGTGGVVAVATAAVLWLRRAPRSRRALTLGDADETAVAAGLAPAPDPPAPRHRAGRAGRFARLRRVPRRRARGLPVPLRRSHDPADPRHPRRLDHLEARSVRRPVVANAQGTAERRSELPPEQGSGAAAAGR